LDHLTLTLDRLTSKAYGFSMWVHLPGMRYADFVQHITF